MLYTKQSIWLYSLNIHHNELYNKKTFDFFSLILNIGVFTRQILKMIECIHPQKIPQTDYNRLQKNNLNYDLKICRLYISTTKTTPRWKNIITGHWKFSKNDRPTTVNSFTGGYALRPALGRPKAGLDFWKSDLKKYKVLFLEILES